MPTLSFVQALRAVAALLVVFGHSLAELQVLPAYSGLPLETSFYYHFGVDIFFVISGFIMVYTTLNVERSAGSARRFLSSRLIRIVPLYWLLTLATLALSFMLRGAFNRDLPSVEKVIGSFTFIPVRDFEVAEFSADVMPVLGLGWTLNYEMLFYLIFAISLLLRPRAGAIFVLGALVILSLAGALLDPVQTQLRFWTQPIILEFGLGVALGLVAHRLARLDGRAWWLLFGLGWAAFVCIHFIEWPRSQRFLFAGIPALLVVAGGVTADLQGRSRIPAVLMLLGAASYSIYLSHIFVLRALRMAWSILGIQGGAVLFCLAGLGGAAVTGIVLMLLVERPVHHRLKRAFFGRGRPMGAVAENDKPQLALGNPAAEGVRREPTP